MASNKKQKEIKKFILSEKAITFISKFVIPFIELSYAIDAPLLDDITNLASGWALGDININDDDKNNDCFIKERNEMANDFVMEITSQWDFEVVEPDFDDLNNRLGLTNK